MWKEEGETNEQWKNRQYRSGRTYAGSAGIKAL